MLFGSPDGYLVMRDVQTGAMRRSALVCPNGGPQGRRLAVTQGTAVAACREEVVAVNISTAAIRWRYQPPLDTTYDDLPGFVGLTYPAADAATVYVPAWGATVSAVSAATGQAQWVWSIPRLASDTAANVFRSGATGVAVSGDTVFVTAWHFTNPLGGTSEALLFALDAASGDELWRLALPTFSGGGSTAVPPILAGAFALVLTSDGTLFAVRRATGEIAWQYRSSDYRYGTTAAPAVLGDVIYASMGDERVTALQVADGNVLWSTAALGATKDMLATDRRVYVPRDGRLNVHDRSSGALVATGFVRNPEDGLFSTGAAALGDRIFITGSDGAWAFREPD